MAKKTIIRTVKKKPKTLSRLAVKSIDHQYIGDEPVDISQRDYADCLNWYTYSCDHDQARAWLLEYVKREKPKSVYSAVAKAPKWSIPTTIGWQSRMMLNGNNLPDSSMSFFESRLQSVIDAKVEKVESIERPVVSIRDRSLKKNNDLLAEAESAVVDDGKPMYEWLTANEVTSQAASHILSFYQKVHDEIHSDDADIKLAYGKKLKSERQRWTNIIDDLNRFVGNKKVVKVRKPRAKKTKPLVDQVKNFQYQKEYPQLKIVSVNPTEIIGAQQVWTLNTKYNKLTKLVALGPNGLQIKGTSIIGYDVETSSTKRCRKAEDVTKKVLSAGKLALRKIMDEISSLRLEPTARINTSTVILRVVK